MIGAPQWAHGQSKPGAQDQAKKEKITENEATIRRLEKVTPLSSTNYRNQYKLANAYYESGEFYVEAEERYRRAIELNDKFLEAYVNLGALVEELNRPDEAIELLKKALELDPDNCKARSNLANVYYHQKKYPDSMYQLRQALAADPECYTALFNMGVAFADVGLYRDAVKYWKEVVRIAPKTDAARQAADNVTALEPLIGKVTPPGNDDTDDEN